MFVCISEYSDKSSVSRARGDFFCGRARVLLITERFLFYNNVNIRGIHHIVCYTPPVRIDLYIDLVNAMENIKEKNNSEFSKSNSSSVTTAITNLILFDKTDALSLQRLIGTRQVKSMLNDDGRIFKI